MREAWVQFLGWEDPLEEDVVTLVFLPGESHGQRSLAGYSLWGRKEPGRTERLSIAQALCYSLIYRQKEKENLKHSMVVCSVLEVHTGCNGISELEVRRVQWRRNFQFKDSSDLAKLNNSLTNMEMTHSCERAGGKSEFVSQRQWNRQQAPLRILRVRNEETAAGWPVPVLGLGLS